MERRRLVLLCVGVTLAAAACGRQGAPLPPIVRVAQRTTDLSVLQEGTEARLVWTYPSRTSAGGPLPDVEAFEVWRLGLAPGEEPQGTGARYRALQVRLLEARGARLVRLEGEAIEAHTRGSRLEVRDDLLRWYEEERERFPLIAWYAVRTVCCGGRASPFSNIARLVPKPPPDPPSWDEPVVDEDGITLHWTGADAVLVERFGADRRWVRLTDSAVGGDSWADTGAPPGSTWSYRLRAVLHAGPKPVVGEPGDVLEVPHPDVYPPAVPDNLVCLPEPTAVRLRWDAVSDAASYRVFRRENDQGWDRLDAGLSGLEYVDDDPPAGVLTYAVKAVDSAGNESSETTCEVTVSEVR